MNRNNKISYTSDADNVNRDIPTALVLEGGGMRSVFTAGVLDFFMEKGIEFPYTIGVSGGASNGLSYMSRQQGRAHYANITLMEEHPYIGLSTLIKKRRIIDLEFLFGEFAFNIYPYDFDAFFNNSNRFEMVTTHCITGEAMYLSELSDADRLLRIGKASCSLPFISSAVEVDGEPMMDGGLADSIPLLRAFEQGYKHAIVVLTRNKGYRKKVSNTQILPYLLSKYPKIREMLHSRAQRYNERIEWVEEMEDRGEVTIFRPQKPLKVGRLTSNTQDLQELYDQGHEVAKQWYHALKY